MLQRLKIFVILTIAFAICAPSFAFKFTSTWSPSDAQQVNFSGKKVVVLVLGENLQKTLPAEEQLAKEITARGAQGIAGHKLISVQDIRDQDKVKSQLTSEGISGAVVIRAWIKGQKAEGSEAFDNPQNRGFWTFYGQNATASTSSGQLPDNVNLYVETRVYSLDQDALVWTGSVGTKSSKLDKFVQELVPAVVKEMQKRGLLKQ